jgi:hypothetical protein
MQESIGVLFASFWGLPPIPGQTPNGNGLTSHKPEEQADSGERPSKPTALLEKNCDSETFKNDADCKAAENKNRTVSVSIIPPANISIERNADRDFFDWIAFGSGMLLAIAGGCGILIALRGVKATEKAADAALASANAANAQIKAMKDKERARITVAFPIDSLTLDDGPEWTQAMNAVYAGTRIAVANLGETSAFNVAAKVEIIGTFDDGTPSFSEVSLFTVPGVLKANMEPFAEDVITLLKGINHAAAVKGKSEILHLVGTITYDDVFDDPHETQFRYLWEVGGVNIEGKNFDFTRWQRTAEGNRST